MVIDEFFRPSLQHENIVSHVKVMYACCISAYTVGQIFLKFNMGQFH
jgi:hypothetical protein